MKSTEIYAGLWQGGWPPPGEWLASQGFSTLVLCAHEYQPPRVFPSMIEAQPGLRDADPWPGSRSSTRPSTTTSKSRRRETSFVVLSTLGGWWPCDSPSETRCSSPVGRGRTVRASFRPSGSTFISGSRARPPRGSFRPDARARFGTRSSVLSSTGYKRPWRVISIRQWRQNHRPNRRTFIPSPHSGHRSWASRFHRAFCSRSAWAWAIRDLYASSPQNGGP